MYVTRTIDRHASMAWVVAQRKLISTSYWIQYVYLLPFIIGGPISLHFWCAVCFGGDKVYRHWSLFCAPITNLYGVVEITSYLRRCLHQRKIKNNISSELNCCSNRHDGHISCCYTGYTMCCQRYKMLQLRTILVRIASVGTPNYK
jgi:hypothetical protein